ncbi:hypothetical protein [Parvularcula lutaonensis]|uniref:GYF domain-containing protein n=1 Tax=Parvularcula lutaonensis TaxID=491923 RepID=A0ABV7M8R4_9PROT|nr:hypothetical protein [Parvularcula lutaonensis]GGY44634.1 hypothetical protein GCM10007148_11930 [Parvularcula lutaonensis]
MATENWCMSVGGRIYGPYPTSQMASFVAEKRLAYHSLVAPAGSRDFRQALQFDELRPLFQSGPASASLGGSLRACLVIFADGRAAEGNAAEILGRFADSRALSGSVYLVRGELDAESLRAELAQAVRGGERLMVIGLDSGDFASQGVALTEHETLAALFRDAVERD